MTEDEIRQLLRELGQEQPPPDSLVRVRERVAARTARKPRRWFWLAAGVAAAMAVIGVLLFVPKPETPTVATVAPPPPVILTRPEPPPQQPKQRPRPIRRPATATSPQVVIRMETKDPDVVIFLIADQTE